MHAPTYRPQLDALRFFAFLSVFLFHTQSFRHHGVMEAGAFGLTLFFLLSSFLITSTLVRERTKTGTVQLSSFFARRILRIWPLYLLGILLGATAGPLLLQTPMRHSAIASLLLMAGNLWVLRHGWFSVFIDPLWSISLEEQFYLTVPWFFTRPFARFGRSLLTGIFVAIFAVALLVQARLTLLTHADFRHVWLNSFVQFQFFVAGALLALRLHNRTLALKATARLALTLAGTLAWLLASRTFRITDELSPPPGPAMFLGLLCVLAGTVCLFLAILDAPIALPRPVLYLGKISFGLYVFHQFFLTVFKGNGTPPVLVAFAHRSLAGTLCAFAATVLCATVSYEYFEKPFLRLKRHFEVVPTRSA